MKMIDFDINKLPIPLKRQKELRRQLETLEAYEDKTPISDAFLIRNGFEKRIITNGKPTLPSPTYLYCDEVEEISAKCIDAEMGVWRIEIGFLDHGNTETLDICTLGQLRMFLAIEGLSEIVKQFK